MAKTEKEVAREAARMLQSDLRSVISGSRLKMSNTKDSIARATSSFRMVRGEPNHLRGLAIVMPKHGFIQNHGVDITRTGHIFKSSKGNRFKRKQHSFKVKPSPFIEELMKKTKAVDYVEKEIVRLRGEEMILNIKKLLEN